MNISTMQGDLVLYIKDSAGRYEEKLISIYF